MTTAGQPFSSHNLHAVWRLWIGMLGPPLLFLVNLGLSYVLVPAVCSGPRLPHAVLHLVNALMLALTLGAGAVAWRSWRDTGSRLPADVASIEDRSRLMALLGLLAAGFFGALIVAQWIPTAMLGACLRAT